MPALDHLREAVARAERGERAGARRSVGAALAGAGGDARVFVVGGLVSFATRDYQRALDLLERAAQAPPTASRARSLQIEIASQLGWNHDAIELIESTRDRGRDGVAWMALRARLLAQARAWPDALREARAAVALAPDAANVWMEVASLAARAGEDGDALRALAATIDARPDDAVYRLEAARVLVHLGRFEEARGHLDRAAALGRPADAYVALARLAAWAGDDATARRHAAAGGEHADAAADASAILAGLDVVAGLLDRAMAHAERALSLDPDHAEAHAWCAETAIRAGDLARAARHIDRAMIAPDEFPLAAWLLHLWALLREDGHRRPSVPPAPLAEVLDGLLALCPEAEAACRRRDVVGVTAWTERALARLRGNRSTTPTRVVDGRLIRVCADGGPRFASRRALELIRAVPAARALDALDAAVDRFPASSLPLAHRGELRLWLGDGSGARVDLERAIALDAHTRWAYIGLCGVDLLDGEPERALATCARGVKVMGGTEGPAVFVYRGEALRRLGRNDAAMRDLERAVALRPSRLGAWMNLALACDAGGDAERAAALFERLQRDAPGLISDAAHAEGEPVWLDGEAPASASARRRVLERALVMMGGNRSSSCHTYVTDAGRLRLVPTGQRDVAAAERNLLARARAWL